MYRAGDDFKVESFSSRSSSLFECVLLVRRESGAGAPARCLNSVVGEVFNRKTFGVTVQIHY
jgi:hypothetical protein